MPVLIYVDNILCPTNNEEMEIDLFNEMNKTDGIKDQGLLSGYLGIRVSQTEKYTSWLSPKLLHSLVSDSDSARY